MEMRSAQGRFCFRGRRGVRLLAALLVFSGGAAAEDFHDSRTTDDGIWARNPWIVRDTDGCTGTFIAPDVILSAAHCILRFDDLNYATEANFLVYRSGANADPGTGRSVRAGRIDSAALPLRFSNGDWVLYRTIDYTHPREWVAPVDTGQASGSGYRSIGYGYLRVIKAHELSELRNRHMDFLCLYSNHHNDYLEWNLDSRTKKVCEERLASLGITAVPRNAGPEPGSIGRISPRAVDELVFNRRGIFEFNRYLTVTNPNHGGGGWVYPTSIAPLIDSAPLLKEAPCSGSIGYAEFLPGSFLEIRCFVVGGNSGGPLLDSGNRVAGVACSSGSGGASYQRMDLIADRIGEAISSGARPPQPKRPIPL